MAYSPENPIGSTSPKDLMANAENTDLLALGNEHAYPDRKGALRKSWKGMESDFSSSQNSREQLYDLDRFERGSEFAEDQDIRAAEFNWFLKSSGYETPVDYAPGVAVTRLTQQVRYLGELYRAKASAIPFTTSTFAADLDKWLSNGDNSIRQELGDPRKGGALLRTESIYGSEQVGDTLNRHELTGQEAGVAKYQGQNAGVARLFLAGYDSLTDGAGGSDWHRYFRKIMRGQLGYGGPGLQLFDNTVAAQEGAAFGVSGMSPIVENGQNYTYSLGGKGVYAVAATGSAYLDWRPGSAWKSARVYYLKQPGGGTFNIGTSDQTVAAMVSVDTVSDSFGLGFIDVSIGSGSSGRGVAVRTVTGAVCLFGGLFINSDTGFLFGNIARGGRKLADVAAQDSLLRKQWFAALQPSYFLLNGGANDKSTRTGAQHNADLTKIITDVQEVSPTTSIVLIQHNHIYGEETTFLPEQALQKIAVAKAKGVGYFDVRRLLGSYVTANMGGYMFDGTHPSDKANRAIAGYYAEQIGFSANSADPGAASYNPGGTDLVVRAGSLSTKHFVVAAGVKTQIYKLGLAAGFTNTTLRMTVCCNRNGSGLSATKLILVTVRNGTSGNSATGVTTPATAYSILDANAGDFTISAEVVSGKCIISTTPAEYDSNIVVECDYSVPYNPSAGQVIFEN
ncbi:SGNH/GDSL hydrolase family protein [Pseudomonas fragi]|nr:SGNH/GDSL hydrolase family protein [Pseudomonas fragi]